MLSPELGIKEDFSNGAEPGFIQGGEELVHGWQEQSEGAGTDLFGY